MSGGEEDSQKAASNATDAADEAIKPVEKTAGGTQEAKALANTKTVSVYRVEETQFPRIKVNSDGTVNVPEVTTKSGKERTLWLNFGQPQRAKEFAQKRQQQGKQVAIKKVEVDASLLENLRQRAIYDKGSEVKDDKTKPLKGDINQADDQFGLRTSEDIESFRKAIIPESGQTIDPEGFKSNDTNSGSTGTIKKDQRRRRP